MHLPLSAPALANDRFREFYCYSYWLFFRALPRLLIAAVAIMLLTVSPGRAQEADSVRPNGVQSGQMLIHDRATGQYTPAVIHDSKVHFDISGMIAQVRLEQTFRNDTDGWVEAVYAFPLPDTGAVKAMEMQVGERLIRGNIKEKSIAKKIYQQAKKAGKKASLVAQQRPNLFTNRVANIGPGELITVRLDYVQQVDFGQGEFSLRFPMTITPRYIPGAPTKEPAEHEANESLEFNPYLGWAQATDVVPDASAITPLLNPNPGSDAAPINAIEITVELDVGMPLAKVDAAYHELAMARSKNRYEIRLANRFSEMDRDFVMSWQAVTGAAPQAAVFTERVGEEHYGLLMVIPPALESSKVLDQMAREIILVIDTSGSMGGVAIEQARESLSVALNGLKPQDSFNVIEFNSHYRMLFNRAVAASPHNVQQGLEYVRHLEAGGGTEMLPALRAAFGTPRASLGEGGQRIRQVVFVTDGAVGNEQQLFEEITQRLGDNRLFTVGIGSAPNSWFMRKSAQFGRGTHLHIGDLSEVSEKMATLFTQIATPVAANINIQWPVGVESFPQKVSDLYKGEPVVVAVNSGTTPLEGLITVSGDVGGQLWSRQLELGNKDREAMPDHPGVGTLWARRKITSLLDELVTGRSKEQVRADVLEVALKHALLSPYTSFVAVEEKISRPKTFALAKAAVANSRPKGQSPQSFAYPKTATTGPANVFFGCLSLFIAMMFVVMRREEVDHVPTTTA
ncbi:MAG: Ca-activated chloride channel family protein [Halioglobus sp.]|jgi:Ca-activated chloride channel family protein